MAHDGSTGSACCDIGDHGDPVARMEARDEFISRPSEGRKFRSEKFKALIAYDHGSNHSNVATWSLSMPRADHASGWGATGYPAGSRSAGMQLFKPSARGVLRLAIVSRTLTLAMMVLHDALFRDLSTSAHLQRYPCNWAVESSVGRYEQVERDERGGNGEQDALFVSSDETHRDGTHDSSRTFLQDLETSMASLTPWDSVYFVRIAQCGYESDQIFAFFPLLPFFMWVGGKFARTLYAGWLLGGHVMGMGQWGDEVQVALAAFGRDTTTTITMVERIGMVWTGLAVNFGAFCVAAVVLYRLGVGILGDPRVAYLGAVLFCFNPASVFYSAVYTESLFGAFTWLGMWLVLTGRFWGGVGCLTAASVARSNGILGVWFLLWTDLIGIQPLSTSISIKLLPLWRRILRVLMGGTIVCLPYVCMQVYGWVVFCSPFGGRGNGMNHLHGDAPFHYGENTPSWCKATVPSIYGFIQHEYWDVGFLNFYQKLIRLPFVVQSIPVVVLSVSTCWNWAFGPWVIAGRPGRTICLTRLLTLGFVQLDPRTSKRVAATLRHPGVIVRPLVAPFVYHLALMTSVAMFVMHVNVATRFLSSSPLLFWGAAQWILNDPRLWAQGGKIAWRWRLMLFWFASYTVLGTLMFPNFYPWV